MNASRPYLNSPRRAPRPGALRQTLHLLGVAAGAAALIAFVAGSWFYWKMKGSLPQIDGSAPLAGLAAPVKVERDAQGVATVSGQNFLDVARGLGYAHGQDRFFQMDLSRRRGAGELAELVGKRALPLDRRARVHEFRPLAQKVLAGLPPDQRAALEAYAAGVNAGLASLAVKPFEYVALRVKPAPWRAEDSLLVSSTMAFTLQDDQGEYLRVLHRLRITLGEKAVDFFSPRVGPMDAALDGSSAALPPMPGPLAINLRGKSYGDSRPGSKPGAGSLAPADAEIYPGSNAFAVAGTRGAAVLANDMHLSLGLPNIWYRASLVWPGHRVTGVTLPGFPAIVAGSNGQVAWGFTNSKAGTGDLILVNTDMADFYRGPDADELPIRTHESIIKVKGGGNVRVATDWTVWGPVVARGDNNQLIVYHWAMDDPSATNCNLLKLSDVSSVAQAMELAHTLGIPAENLIAADSAGRIGWTVAGFLPKRVGYNGRWAVLWQYRDRKWDGWLSSAEVPTVTGQPYLWSANQRMLGGAALEKLGDSGYARGARAQQVRDDLKALAAAGPVSPAELLQIQLDDRARFLAWWRDLALNFLPPGPVRDAVEHDSAEAAVGSKGYRFVREFRDRVARAVLDPIFASCAEDDDNFDWSRLNYEPALRELLTKKPIHLLNPQFESWDDLIKAQIKAQSDRLATWGSRNVLRLIHPLSRALPGFLTGWLNLPGVELPGDSDMPRVQSPTNGASERFAVSPGHEEQGIFEMPGGQSGHPLSPFYAAGNENWVQGKPSPFLPGATAHTLMLQPE